MTEAAARTADELDQAKGAVAELTAAVEVLETEKKGMDAALQEARVAGEDQRGQVVRLKVECPDPKPSILNPKAHTLTPNAPP